MAGERLMARKRDELSEAEQEVLKTLWEMGPGTVREVCEALNRDGRRRVYTTVLTFLARLEAKGYVASDKQDVAHVFSPIVSREALLSQRLTRLVDEVCEGTATPVVQALVKGKHLSSDDIAQLRRLLDDLEQQDSSQQTERPAAETRRKRKK
jgi:BlaI family penicillinase repressor